MSQEESNETHDTFTCPECQAGILTIQHITYFTQMGGELIAVPEFPAWICDVCGRCEYDHRALSWLNVLLAPHAGRTQRPARRPSSSADDSPGSTLTASAKNG